MSLCVLPCVHLYGILYTFRTCFLSNVGVDFARKSSTSIIFWVPFSFSFPSENSYNVDVGIFNIVQEVSLFTMPKPLTVWITINWKILQEMGIPDHLTCLLRNLYASQKATVRTGHGTTEWFQIGKGERQGCILSPCLFNFYEEYIMRNAALEEAQAGIKIARRNINNLRYADDTTLMAESEEEKKKKASWWKWKWRVKNLA